ncbi:MAG: trehalose-6-phosphate synthase [Dehalococcoidia bacterium]|nr:trehalose-6-phosphate synthase [Dehalococcoidia bacterium]
MQVEGLSSLLERSLTLLRIWGLLGCAFFAAKLAGAMETSLSQPLAEALLGMLIVLMGATMTEGVWRLVGHFLAAAKTPQPLVKFAQVSALLSFGYLTLLILVAEINISVTPLLGLGALGAIPLLLVLQDSASDLFFYFRLMRRQHLRIGDFVRLENGVAGHVESVTWQDVRILTPANNLVVIPNRRLARMIVTNFHLPSKRTALTIPIVVTRGPSPEAIKSILADELQQAVHELPGLAPDVAPEIRMASDTTSPGSSFVVLCQVEDVDLVEGVEREVVRRVARRFRKEEIQSPLLDSVLGEDTVTEHSRSSQDLKFLAQSKFGDVTFVVASNREPYIHSFEGRSIHWDKPASGMTTALDPIMRSLGGVWVAVGSGNADREVSDTYGRIPVPPDRPAYTLRRLWLTKQQEERYYNGFSNSALWPLCHTVYVRPKFDADEWKCYEEVNRLFAKAILEETRGKRAFVFLQDYHLALVPRLLRDAGANVTVAHFWHIPWPTSEVFRTCPWAEHIIEGLLGADLLGFHTRYHCNNFLATVDRTVESRVDYGRYSVTRRGRQSLVRPFGISIDFEAISQGVASPPVQRERARFLQELAIPNGYIGLGVDRLDYTKGIPERLRAIDRFLGSHPEYKGKFTFIQVAVPSRSQVEEYRDEEDKVQRLVEEVNWRHKTGLWQPIIYLHRYFPSTSLWALYSLADLCIVSSLHDGMNLVAKEYVAAKTDGKGVLILSKFTGAATEFTDALLVNPYDTEQLAQTIRQGLEMHPSEQDRRMKRMRAYLYENDIYHWAIRVLNELVRVEPTTVESLLTAEQ